MLFFLFLILPAAYSQNCVYHFDGMAYSRSAILTIRGLPTNLAYNPANKDLHFTLIDTNSLLNDQVQTQMDQYILRNNVPIKIENVNGQAAAVDVQNNRVYIAGDDGLYVLNSADQGQFFSNKESDIVQIFKPNNTKDLYVVMYPENDVYVIDVEKNEKRKIDKIPCAFIIAVDNEENIYYECDSKYIKMLRKGFQEPIEFVGIPKNSARAVTIDNYARVIMAANDGLYELTPTNVIPIKHMDLDFVPSGVVFDDDDFYLATDGVIYKYSNDDCQ